MNNRTTLLRGLLLLFALSNISALPSQVIYVKSGSTGDGSSWNQALGDLQAALDLANSQTEIWVAEGIYTPTSCIACMERDRKISFIIPNGVEVYGGFEGDEMSLSERSVDDHPTILSGDIDHNQDASNNSFNIVYFENVDSTTILDGFQLVGGNANLPIALGEKGNSGAAIFNQGHLANGASRPKILNCWLRDNYATGFGGAVFSDSGFSGSTGLAFKQCRFTNNVARKGGGAIYVNSIFDGTSLPFFDQCQFSDNRVDEGEGGAVYLNGSANGQCLARFDNCIWRNNQAQVYGGALFSFGKTGKSNIEIDSGQFLNNKAAEGGAIYSDGSFSGESNTKCTNCIFQHNEASGDGGALYNLGAENGESNGLFDHCRFEKNICLIAGAAVFNNGSSNGQCHPVFSYCHFTENETPNYGGGIYNLGAVGNCSPQILNCLFAKNKAYSAGAVYNLGADHGQSNPLILNCTFFANQAEVCGAIYSNGSDSTGTSAPTIVNCLFYGNTAPTGPVFRTIFGSPKVSYSAFDVADCAVLESGVSGQFECGDGLIFSIDDVFENMDDDDFRLKNGSGVINRGNNDLAFDNHLDTDLSELPRISYDTIDIGAYEYVDLQQLLPVITAQSKDSIYCEGSVIALEVEVGGAGPFQYVWYKNQQPIASVDEPMLDLGLAMVQSTGLYIVEVSNNYGMVTSVPISVGVIERDSASIEIASAGIDLCVGDTLLITTFLEEAGANPQIDWMLDGEVQQSANAGTWQYSSLPGVHEIQAVLTSDAFCLYEPQVYSNVLAIQGQEKVTPEIEILGPDTVLCLGTEAHFVSRLEFAGNNPVIQWFVDELPTHFGSGFSTSSLTDQQVISSVLVSSLSCITSDSVFSNEIVVTVDSCISSIKVIVDEMPIVYPNPAKDWLGVKTAQWRSPDKVSLFDQFGILQWEGKNFRSRNIKIDINDLKAGIYYLRVSYPDNHYVTKIYKNSY